MKHLGQILDWSVRGLEGTLFYDCSGNSQKSKSFLTTDLQRANRIFFFTASTKNKHINGRSPLEYYYFVFCSQLISRENWYQVINWSMFFLDRINWAFISQLGLNKSIGPLKVNWAFSLYVSLCTNTTQNYKIWKSEQNPKESWV